MRACKDHRYNLHKHANIVKQWLDLAIFLFKTHSYIIKKRSCLLENGLKIEDG